MATGGGVCGGEVRERRVCMSTQQAGPARAG